MVAVQNCWHLLIDLKKATIHAGMGGEEGPELEVGDLIFGKVQGTPHWPAQVCAPYDVQLFTILSQMCWCELTLQDRC